MSLIIRAGGGLVMESSIHLCEVNFLLLQYLLKLFENLASPHYILNFMIFGPHLLNICPLLIHHNLGPPPLRNLKVSEDIEEGTMIYWTWGFWSCFYSYNKHIIDWWYSTSNTLFQIITASRLSYKIKMNFERLN